jgi:hypothetical protein
VCIGNRTPRAGPSFFFGGEFCDIDHLVIIFSYKRATLLEFTVGKQIFPNFFVDKYVRKKNPSQEKFKFFVFLMLSSFNVCKAFYSCGVCF